MVRIVARLKDAWRPRHSRMALKRWLLWFLLAFVALDFFLPSIWLLAPIEGQVVDAISGRPIAGAAVAASWGLEWMASVGQLDVAETETTQSGQFHLSGWRLRAYFYPGHVGDNQPTLWVFKEEFLPQQAFNRCCGYVPPRFLVRMPVMRVNLTALPASDVTYAGGIRELTEQLASTFAIAPCKLSQIPNMVERLQRTQRALETRGLGVGIGLPPVSHRCTVRSTEAGVRR